MTGVLSAATTPSAARLALAYVTNLVTHAWKSRPGQANSRPQVMYLPFGFVDSLAFRTAHVERARLRYPSHPPAVRKAQRGISLRGVWLKQETCDEPQRQGDAVECRVVSEHLRCLAARLLYLLESLSFTALPPARCCPMSDVTIECPHCHKPFMLSETLAAPLVEETRRKFQREFEEKERTLEERREAFREEQNAIQKARMALDTERAAVESLKGRIEEAVAEQVAEKRAAIEHEAAKKARQKYDEQLDERNREKAELEEQIRDQAEKLAESRKAELETRKKQRELDDKLKAADVELEKRLAEALGPEREKARKAADDDYRLKLEEEREKSRKLLEQLEEAKRRAEQGSQQLQGEIQEMDLEKRLREAFPRDTIEPVPKGQFGGDTLHYVLGLQGVACGTILWESKRTKNWAGSWPDKLKQDQRVAKADLAVIVTRAMPSGVDTFGEVEGVWVTTPGLALPLAAALRLALTEASLARRATEGQQDKMAILYQYLTGPHFRQRVEAIKDAFTTMQEDLDAERRVITKQWEKRAKQIERVMVSTVGMYGDLQAIAGKTMQEIEGLEIKALGHTASD